jgi:hypothetical protein
VESRYPVAQWRPLSDINSEPTIVPTQLVWHTMVGYLKSSETLFKRNGYDGVESTFGLGGKYDGALDGVLYQWQLTTRQADAQAMGNARANSIECSDGGHWTEPFSDRQVEASIRLGVWWCRQTGVAPVKAPAWNAPGFGYHNMFPQWNPDGHACPGPARASQLEKEIWPEIAHVIRGGGVAPPSLPSFPVFPLSPGYYFGPKNGPTQAVSGYFGHKEDLRLFQQQLRSRGWDIATDGLYGTQDQKVISLFQKEKKLAVDGLVGEQTWNAAWRARVT